MLERALALARRGFRVFPLRENANKPPLIDDFPTLATTDEAQIRQWWTQRPRANIGISTNGLCVIDADPKRGGLSNLAVLEAENGPIGGMRVRTPSGGLHIYTVPNRPVANSVDKLAPGIDVRGQGGYVAGPGSVRSDGAYEEIA